MPCRVRASVALALGQLREHVAVLAAHRPRFLDGARGEQRRPWKMT